MIVRAVGIPDDVKSAPEHIGNERVGIIAIVVIDVIVCINMFRVRANIDLVFREANRQVEYSQPAGLIALDGVVINLHFICGKDIITYLRNSSRAYIFSAALPPAQAAAANESFKVILDKPERIEKLNLNTKQFINGLKSMGFDTMLTETAIVPVLCGDDEKAFMMTAEAQHKDVFVLPVVSPAVPEGLARLRATVTAAHDPSEIERAMDVIGEAGKKLGIIK